MNCKQKKQDKKNALLSFYGVLKTRTMQQMEKKFDKTSNPTLSLLGV